MVQEDKFYGRKNTHLFSDMVSLMCLQSLGVGVSGKQWDLGTQVWWTLASDGHGNKGRQERVKDRQGYCRLHRRRSSQGRVMEPVGGRRCEEGTVHRVDKLSENRRLLSLGVAGSSISWVGRMRAETPGYLTC